MKAPVTLAPHRLLGLVDGLGRLDLCLAGARPGLPQRDAEDAPGIVEPATASVIRGRLRSLWFPGTFVSCGNGGEVARAAPASGS